MKRAFVSKTDLAMAYFPFVSVSRARHKLMELIESNAELMAALFASGYKRLTRTFSPLQVDMIMDKFGNPYK